MVLDNSKISDENANSTCVNNYHCTVIHISTFGGILIRGDSGSGKTCLSLGLLEALAQDFDDVQFVCDDQALLHSKSDSLVANAPVTTAGQIEIRGFGISSIKHRKTSNIALVIDILDDNLIERMPNQKNCEILSVVLPRIEVPKHHEAQSVRIIKAWLNEKMRAK